jgi:hypothetical protein
MIEHPVPVPLLLGASPPPAVRKPLAATDLDIIKSAGFRERFTGLIRRAESGCIVWSGSTNGNGYGKVRVRAGLTVPAHNAAWIMHYRSPIPDYLELDHTCNNSLCVNIAHLEAVTHEENIRRADERRKVRIIRTATVRLRAGKYQVRWREGVDGRVLQRGRTFDSLDDAEGFMASLPNT